jgi:ribosome silencing factor RsfS/YbeB/iojap
MSDLVSKIIDILETYKCFDIKVYRLENSSYVSNCVVIASCISDKQGSSACIKIGSMIKSEFGIIPFLDVDSSKWCLVDMDDCMVHVFEEQERKKYDLDELVSSFNKKTAA